MKSTITMPDEPLPFPKLMVTSDGTVVFFASEGHGTCVSEASCGFYSTLWGMGLFTDLPHGATVTLSNGEAS